MRGFVSQRKPARSQFQLANVLSALGRGSSKDKGPRGRANVVNPKLCDDILTYVGPSLSNYKGCDIIEIFPGAGLWSQKVNKFLNPRLHFVVEPTDQHFVRFLADDLAKPKTSFRHVNHDFLDPKADHKNVLETIMQMRLSATMSEKSKKKPPLLVLLNLTRIPPRYKEDFPISATRSGSAQVMYRFSHQVQIRDNLNGDKPARMLVWMLNHDKAQYLPTSVSRMTARSQEVDEAFAISPIVAGVDAPSAHMRSRPMLGTRQPLLEVQSAMNVAERMAMAGLSMPEHRSTELHKKAAEAVAVIRSQSSNPSRDENLDLSSTFLEQLKEFRALEAEWMSGSLQKKEIVETQDAQADGRLQKHSPKLEKLKELRKYFSDLTSCPTDSVRLVQSEARLNGLLGQLHQVERDVKANENQGLDTTALQQSMQVLEESIDGLSGTMPKQEVQKAMKNRENIDAAERNPPVFAWDRRPFEALTCDASEFYPAHRLALLDFQPRDIKDWPGHFDIRVPFIYALRSKFGEPVEAALDSLAHGCAEALIPECPSLKDPLQGGRLNLKYLRVRMLTTKMWMELLSAWNQWPFKTSDIDLLPQRSSRGSHQFEEYPEPESD